MFRRTLPARRSIKEALRESRRPLADAASVATLGCFEPRQRFLFPLNHGQHSGLAGARAAALLAAALARPAEAATGDVDADVVFVADASGEFARTVPYQTAKPMLGVGDAGLTPTAWHWSWFEYGAPQLQHRFQKYALPRRMNAEA